MAATRIGVWEKRSNLNPRIMNVAKSICRGSSIVCMVGLYSARPCSAALCVVSLQSLYFVLGTTFVCTGGWTTRRYRWFKQNSLLTAILSMQSCMKLPIVRGTSDFALWHFLAANTSLIAVRLNGRRIVCSTIFLDLCQDSGSYGAGVFHW